MWRLRAMDTISYKNQLDSNNDVKSVTVWLEGHNIGMIKRTLSGWAYFPKGHEHGEVLDSIQAVKKSLETEE
jgi:hypothetical protein